MDCSQPGSSDHGILQLRILEWVAMLSASSLICVVGAGVGLRMHTLAPFIHISYNVGDDWQEIGTEVENKGNISRL